MIKAIDTLLGELRGDLEFVIASGGHALAVKYEGAIDALLILRGRVAPPKAKKGKARGKAAAVSKAKVPAK